MLPIVISTANLGLDSELSWNNLHHLKLFAIDRYYSSLTNVSS